MHSIIRLGLIVSAAATLSFAPAHAQYQNSINGEAARIQQDAANGLINQNQARGLEMRDAQIQNQEQQYLMQNGGRLTSQESHQIRSELKNVNRSLGKDVQRDSGAFGAFQPGFQNMQNGYTNGYANGYPNGIGMQHHHHHGMWQNGMTSQAGMMPQYGMNSQYGMNPQFGMNPQYGINPQYGMNPQYQQYGQQGGVGGLLRNVFNH